MMMVDDSLFLMPHELRHLRLKLSHERFLNFISILFRKRSFD